MLQPFQLPKALHSNQSTQHLEHVVLPIASNTCRTQVAHRDLKSANVLYDRQLTIKLCDLAFSKLKVPALTCSSSSSSLPLTSPSIALLLHYHPSLPSIELSSCSLLKVAFQGARAQPPISPPCIGLSQCLSAHSVHSGHGEFRPHPHHTTLGHGLIR